MLPPKTRWRPLPPGELKINSDVAIREGLPLIGLGAVIRDHNGVIIAAMSKPLQGSFNAEIGEFLALREGLLLAKKSNLTVKIAEVDAVNVALSVNSSETLISDAIFLVKDIKALLKEAGDCKH
ncbi:hypothetical protein LWI28_008908 [Acer negundo]|uniref:RNase H type-1 domain-containing protein n=1 Tax=Acer negundo TaxID=4023 RepID=A0AAD5IDV1_ACENE|nr:hypothetical protein LWI28_008908 [Acer negundo]